jgi:hypothetical protein
VCVSLFLSVLFGSQGTWTFLLSYLEEREQAGAPAPASQGCRGLQIQISPLSPVVHLRMELGRMKPRFIPMPPCSPFPVPRNFSLGRNLVVVAVTRKQTKGLTLLRPCLRQEREYGRMKWGDGKACCRATMFILEITRIHSLAWASPTNKEPGKHPFFH